MSRMKYLLLGVVIFISQAVKADWGIWQAYLIANYGGPDVYYSSGQDLSDPTTQLNNLFLGRFTASSTFIIDGAEIKTYKNTNNGTSNVCGGTLFYRIFRTCDTPGSFNSVNANFACNHPCSGLNSSGDQKWDITNANINALSGLTASGTYVIEVYFRAEGNQNDSGGCGEFAYSSNSDQNFRAYFEYENTDSFADGNFSSSAAWSGDAGFQIVNNSDVGGLDGSEVMRTHTLRTNAPGAGSHYLSTQISSWLDQQDWYFWVGRRGIAASATNRMRVWLYSDNTNLEASSGINGYFVEIGQAGNDPVTLYKCTNGSNSVIFTSSATVESNQTDYGVTFHISRSESGVWTIRTSALPQNSTESQASPTALSCPESSSSVVHGTVTDNQHIPAANGYFGFIMTVTGSQLQSIEFDSFRFRAQLPNTKVAFATTSNALAEPSTNASTTIGVNITNPSATVGTSVQVVLTSGDGNRLAGYTPQTITWNAGEGSTKYATFTVAANTDCDDVASLNFELQNASGGLNASVAEPANFTLTITDDDTGYATMVNDDFEDSNSLGWTSYGSGSWGASNVAPASGSWSLRHSNTGVAGNSHVAYNAESTSLNGVTTAWRFNLKHFNRDPSPNNKFLVILAADNPNFFGSFNGYGIGVDPLITGDPDIVEFYRITNGVLTSIASTSLDMSTSINEIGFYVERDETGEWTIRIDQSGDFDNLVTEATVTDATYDDFSQFGVRFIYSASNSDRLSLDDILIIQKGCKEEYFSQVPGGDLTDAIWADQEVGTPGSINPGRFTRLTVQSGAPVNLDANLICNSFSLNDGASVTANDRTMKVYGNFVTDGSALFDHGTGTVVFKGNEAQFILGDAEPTFYNLTIDNDFGTMTLGDTVRVRNLLTLEEGTLQTGNRLILLSDNNRSAGIGAIPSGADISGDVTIQRFVPGGSAGYIYIGASTVASPHTIENVWDDDLVTTGVAGSDYPPPYNFVNIYHYYEPTPGGRNAGWIPMENTSDVIDPHRGYSVYVGPGSWTTDVTGTIQKGNVSVPLSYNVTPNSGDGWNLMTNIYPSEIDWMLLEQNSSDVNNYYLYDNNLPGYRSFSSNLGVGSTTRYIPHSQGFFVKATGVNQFLNFTETVKTSQNKAFERSVEEASFVRFTIQREGQGDEAIIAFSEDATNAYDTTLDAEKLESPVTTSPEFAFVSSDEVLLTIDARPMPYEEMVIPLYLDLPAAGEYVIEIPETQNLPFGSCLILEDEVTGLAYTVEAGLTFTIATEEPYQGNRMFIRVTPRLTLNSENLTCHNAADGSIAVNAPAGDWNWTVTSLLGVVVYSGSGASEVSALEAGVYEVVLQSVSGNCGVSEAVIELTEPAETTFEFASEIAACHIGNTGEVMVNITNPGEYQYELINIQGEVVASGTSGNTVLSITGLAPDYYYLEISNYCADETFEFATIDENALTVEPSMAQTVFEWEEGTTLNIELLVSSYNADNVTWTYEGEVVGNGHIIPFTLTEAGEYVFEVWAETETCQATTTVVITGITTNTVGTDEEAVAAFDVICRDGGAWVSIPESLKNTQLRVFSVSGQMVFEQKNVQAQGSRMFVDMNSWAPGVYSFSLISVSGEILQKSVVR